MRIPYEHWYPSKPIPRLNPTTICENSERIIYKPPDDLAIHYVILAFVGIACMCNVYAYTEITVKHYLGKWRAYKQGKKYVGLQGNSQGVVKTHLYDLLLFMQSLSVLAMPIAYGVGHYRSFLSLYVLVAICNVWSFISLIQLIPRVGHFVIIWQNLLSQTVQFVIFYLVFFFSFSGVFNDLTTITHGCSEDFYFFGESMYSTFKITLNMYDLSAIYDELGFPIAFAHILCVIIMSILLINFMIALMSNTVTKISENKSVIFLLKILWISQDVENNSFSRKFIPKRLFRQPKEYYHLENGRYYVMCFEQAPRNNNTRRDGVSPNMRINSNLSKY